MINKRMKIAALVSGGVDSSVALKMVKDLGHDVTAFYLKIWLEDELASLGSCPWQEDLEYVRATCDQLGVPLKVISFQREYQERIVTYTISEIKKGRTPNPDVLCNQRIKFGAFFQAIDNTFDKVVSGHYAHIVYRDGIPFLQQAPDKIKDQTYFLASLNREQLERAWFPIGQMTKKEVRAYARAAKLPAMDRKDSQGICFLGKLRFKDFVAHHVGTKTGDLIEFESGTKLGEHKGFWFYTIGQRRGSGLSGGPWYVVRKDPETNTVYVSCKYYEQDKVRNSFEIDDMVWVNGKAPLEGQLLQVKMRHGSEAHQCTVSVGANNVTYITLQDRDQGIAPGQFAVLYQDGLCLGLGAISRE
jgi:tRNA-5-taurinomethyluridine 2-sulfurtransferase